MKPNIQKINDKIKIIEDMFTSTLFDNKMPDEYEFKKIFSSDIMEVYREAGNYNYMSLAFSFENDKFLDLYNKLYANNIFGLISKNEAKALSVMMLQLGHSGKRIVEVGTFLGFSTCFLAQNNNFVYAIDNKFDHFVNDYEIGFFIGFYHDGDKVWERIPRNILKGEICDNNWRIAGVLSNIMRINKFSSDAVSDIREKVDMVFIDGDHGYEPCGRDTELYFPKIKANGIIAFHDFNQGTHGVALAVHEFYSKYEYLLSPPYISDSIIWFVKKDYVEEKA